MIENIKKNICETNKISKHLYMWKKKFKTFIPVERMKNVFFRKYNFQFIDTKECLL